MIIALSGTAVATNAPYERMHNSFPIAEDKKELSVVDKIWIQGLKQDKVSMTEALDIADCESKLGKQKRNRQGSSASGVFMFINRTWDDYCEGYQMNDDDNIKCFFELYPKHKGWWECASIMQYI